MGFNVLLESLPLSTITEGTIKRMHQLAKEGKTDWKFIQFARSLVQGCPRKDYYCELKTIFDFVKKTIRYVRDPEMVELVQSPWATMESRGGDCDDMAVIVGALMGALGASYKFVTVKADKSRPDDWSHVYVKIFVPHYGWVSADTSVTDFKLGDEAKGFEKKDWLQPGELYE